MKGIYYKDIEIAYGTSGPKKCLESTVGKSLGTNVLMHSLAVFLSLSVSLSPCFLSFLSPLSQHGLFFLILFIYLRERESERKR